MAQYILIADILGFSNIVKNLDSNALDLRVKQWIEFVEDGCKRFEISRFQLLSDTLVVAADANVDGLRSLMLLSRFLLEDGLPKSIPVRGAIAHGEITWGKVIYGKPIVNAYELEKNQNWLGITIENQLPLLETFWGADSVFCYLTPMKEGPPRICPVVSWSVPDAPNLTKPLTAKGLTVDGEVLGWNFHNIVSNTHLYKMYREYLISTGVDPRMYYGTHSTSFLE